MKAKSPPSHKKKDEEKVQPGAESFAQTGARKEAKKEDKYPRCFACGKEGGYANECIYVDYKVATPCIDRKQTNNKQNIHTYKHTYIHTNIHIHTQDIICAYKASRELMRVHQK